MEDLLYNSKNATRYCTKEDLIKALECIDDDSMILLSDGENFFCVGEVVQDQDKDVIVRIGGIY
jgi:hypothetical protein